jgi:hypothetical protein
MKGIQTRKLALTAIVAVLIVGMSLGFGPLLAQTVISADGVVESTSGGFKFPDGTVQATAAAQGTAPVEDTGLAECWDAVGTPRNCAGTGEDGAFQAGVDWPTPRFTDNGDGTVTDNLTGLIWLKDANCAGAPTWQNALNWVATFNGGSPACTDYTAGTFTDWRLPNIKDVLSLVDYGQSNPVLPSPNPFVNVQVAYWSSSSALSDPASARALNMNDGGTVSALKLANLFSWPVRGGQ